MEIKMPVRIYIRKNDTGEIRVYRDHLYKSKHSGDLPETFIWEEGNCRCDCARHCLFSNNEPDDLGCTEGRYCVNVEYNGDIIYREF